MADRNSAVKTVLASGALLLLLATAMVSCSSNSQGNEITGVTWAWSELFETLPASQSVVPDPENFTLMFNADGTLTIKADCNNVGGSYSIDGDLVTLELGPSQLAHCGDQSLDQLFLEMLEKIESYQLEDGDLVLRLEADSGSMTFRAL